MKISGTEYGMILEAMRWEGVFSVKKKGDKFRVMEECDGWAYVDLSPEELRALGEELIALSKT